MQCNATVQCNVQQIQRPCLCHSNPCRCHSSSSCIFIHNMQHRYVRWWHWCLENYKVCYWRGARARGGLPGFQFELLSLLSKPLRGLGRPCDFTQDGAGWLIWPDLQNLQQQIMTCENLILCSKKFTAKAWSTSQSPATLSDFSQQQQLLLFLLLSRPVASPVSPWHSHTKSQCP